MSQSRKGSKIWTLANPQFIDNRWIMSKDKHILFALSPDMTQIVNGKPKTIMKNLGVPSKCSYTGKHGDAHVPCFAVTCIRNGTTETFILQEKHFRVTPTDKVPQYDKDTMKLAIQKSTNGSWFKKIIGKTPEGKDVENTDLDQSNISVGSQGSEVPPTQEEEDVDIGGEGSDEALSPAMYANSPVNRSKNPIDEKDSASQMDTQCSDDSDDGNDGQAIIEDLTSMFILIVVFDL